MVSRNFAALANSSYSVTIACGNLYGNGPFSQPVVVLPSPSATPGPTTKSPYADPTPPIDAEPELVAPVVPPPEDEDEGGVPGWLIWTGIAAAVAGGAVAGILIATSGPSCNTGACLLVELK